MEYNNDLVNIPNKWENVEELYSQGPSEYYELTEEGGHVYKQIPEKVFVNMSSEQRNQVVVRNDKYLFHSKVGLEHIPDEAVIEGENNQTTSLLGERKVVGLSSEQFTVLHLRISQVALRSLQKTEKEEGEPHKPANNTEVKNRTPVEAAESSAKSKTITTFTSFLYREITRTDNKTIEDSRKETKEQKEISEEKTKEKDRIDDKEKKLTINKETVEKDNVKSQEDASNQKKKDSGLEGPPKDKEIKSLSEQEKFDEGIGPSPNA